MVAALDASACAFSERGAFVRMCAGRSLLMHARTQELARVLLIEHVLFIEHVLLLILWRGLLHLLPLPLLEDVMVILCMVQLLPTLVKGRH